jgi:nitrogen regulatory protein PII
MTITEVKGSVGNPATPRCTVRSTEVDFLPKVKFEVLCGSGEADRLVEVIATASRTARS